MMSNRDVILGCDPCEDWDPKAPLSLRLVRKPAPPACPPEKIKQSFTVREWQKRIQEIMNDTLPLHPPPRPLVPPAPPLPLQFPRPLQKFPRPLQFPPPRPLP